MDSYKKYIGKGVVGLGQQELKRRVKQHQALASKARDNVGLNNMIELMQDLGGNKYRVPESKVSSTPLIPGMGPQFSKAVRQTGQQFIKANKNYGKFLHNTYVSVDAAVAGLLPGGVKPYNPFGNKSVKKVAKKNFKKLDR
jgi:hypothetical protein